MPISDQKMKKLKIGSPFTRIYYLPLLQELQTESTTQYVT